VRRFRAFFAVSWVGVEVEGCACADKVGKDSEWVVAVVESLECSKFKATVEDSGPDSDGPGSTLRNPFSTICGFAA